ncbi:DUF445 domain-containing protein [Megasphaera vaginalis (ex Bordigoni et al. 2020)]|uniref:DUF445 domain-containing protein n=1 Tax=Megasphaera vaginalis (ex Bordigoni et al. 2020) TaxID=2045301 RepID=UPI000C7A43DE|nr:DUF445 domain-containing protein [Megasphaera vaginalis (ex Bordigoni et al. 2020)]
MQQYKRSHIAEYILVLAAILLLLAYPFTDSFGGSLVTHMAAAALIGGLADWYAVTALFRRPLGISFKTELVPRSKERIAETARHMIESEILTVPNMYAVLKHHPVLDAALTYLHTERGFQSAERILGQILNTFLYTVDMKKAVAAFSDFGEGALAKLQIAPMAGRAMKTGLSGEAGEDFLDFIILSLETMVRSNTAKNYIADIYSEALRQYEHRNFIYSLIVRAAMASELFGVEHVSASLQRKLLTILDEARDPESQRRKKMFAFFWEQATRLETDEVWQKRVESYKMRTYRHLVERPDMKEAWQRYVQEPQRQNRVCRIAASYAVTRLESWRDSATQVEQMNRYVLTLAARELKRLQTWFGETAEKEILRYDGRRLAEQLEGRVWYDLQMIRVNGSLVGAVLGAFICCVRLALKGGW